MTDKKLTDNEIVKALEETIELRFDGESEYKTVRLDTLVNALDLINRLEEEKERLKEDNEIKSSKRANIFEIVNAFERGKSEAYKEFAERLKKIVEEEIDTYYNGIGGGYYLAEDVVPDIDNLLKELVGEDK